MIATWMLYCLLCAAALSVAALIAERVLLAGRASVRYVWAGAVALSLLVPVIAFRFAPAKEAKVVSIPTQPAALDAAADSPLPVPSPSTETAGVESLGMIWRPVVARLDMPLAALWITFALAVAINFFGGIVALSWMRRRWQRQTVLGVPVFVSEQTGPAVVGALSPAIVLPRWALSLEPSQLALMLRHEQEHRDAGDGRLLTVVQLALIAMPWNVALWWQIFRLRVAVELDCDARVLRSADLRSYGDLLLEVARPRRGPMLTGATAFAEHASQLERRIRVLSRYRVRTPRAARAIAAIAGLVALTVAWVAPHPPVPPRAPESPHVAILAPATVHGSGSTPASSGDTVAPRRVRQSDSRLVRGIDVAPPRAKTERAKVAAPSDRVDSTAVSSQTVDAQGRPALVDSAFNRLFEGIALTSDQAARARDVLVRLEGAQAVADNDAAAAVRDPVKVAAVRAQRDSALRALLTSDADRATFDERLKLAPGGRGRSGGPPPDSLVRALVNANRMAEDARRLMELLNRNPGARVGGGGRGGGRGVPAGDPRPQWRDPSQFLAEATFRRLFAGIPLTSDQETKARDIIAKAQPELTPPRRFPDIHLRLSPSGVVTLRAPSDSALSAILTSEADRAKLRSRMAVIPR